MFVMLDQADT